MIGFVVWIHGARLSAKKGYNNSMQNSRWYLSCEQGFGFFYNFVVSKIGENFQ